MVKAFTRFLIATFLLTSTSAFASNLTCDSGDLARVKAGSYALASAYITKMTTFAQVMAMLTNQAAAVPLASVSDAPARHNHKGQNEAYNKMKASIEAEQAKILPCAEAAEQLLR